jgi:putative nucleotidyltransferase with HDIG domain
MVWRRRFPYFDRQRLLVEFERVNRELWVILSLFLVAGLLNFVVASHRMILGFYTIPTLFSAYFYGRRHATLTAFASVLLVALSFWANPTLFDSPGVPGFFGLTLDLMVWAGSQLIIGYLMGSLYEHKEERIRELRETYHGILLILRHLIAKDPYTEHHSYRVSVYAAKIAGALGLNADRVEDVRAASMLHDIGKLGVSRSILYKAARLTADEFEAMKQHVDRGAELLQPVGGALRRVIPIVLAHHDKFDGSGYHSTRGEEIPLEARIIAVADVYDALTSDRPYRKALATFEARDIIMKGSGAEFDPNVVDAFAKLCQRGEMEIPSLLDLAAVTKAAN